MKKLIIALVMSAAVVASSVPARAGDEAAYAIGGILGGLILGDVLSNNHHHHRHRYYDDAYVYESTPQYVRVCRTHWTGYYDYYGRYIQQPRRICEWEPR